MRDLGRPVYIFEAAYEGQKAAETNLINVNNLHTTISLSINCRIILYENIWTEQGLVNRSLNTVRDIV
jgi:hypothetical protein